MLRGDEWQCQGEGGSLALEWEWEYCKCEYNNCEYCKCEYCKCELVEGCSLRATDPKQVPIQTREVEAKVLLTSTFRVPPLQRHEPNLKTRRPQILIKLLMRQPRPGYNNKLIRV